MKKLALLALLSGAAVASQAQTLYDNIQNFGGQAFSNGGAAADPAAPANTITRMVADDIQTAAGGQGVFQFTFSVANLNATAVTARARVRFYEVDSTTGLPSTYITGFSFNAFSFGTGVSTFGSTLSPTVNFTIPANGKFWAGLTFDNSGAAGTTAAQLNLLGQGTFNPPVIGSSADVAFQTTSNGSFLVNNPAGGTFNFTGGVPVANFGWSFAGARGFNAVPEPASMAALGLGAVALLRRRRNKSA